MAIQNLYPALRPSLDLNFAGSKTVDPRITFTRASSATYFDEFAVLRTASNNVPRIDHNPTTGECLGLLIEEQRTNLLAYSEQFDNAAWTKTRLSIIANAAAAPDGTLTADKIVQDTTASSTHILMVTSATYTTGTNYTLSFYLKPSDGINTVFIQRRVAAFTSHYGVRFDLATGTVITNEAPDWITASAELVGGGWCRVRVTATCTSDYTGQGGFYLYLLNAAGTTIYSGDGTSGIYIWGAQLEAGEFPTSYIKTEASQVTRAADSAVMTGANFSSWYRQDEGCIFADYMCRIPKNIGVLAGYAASISDGSDGNLSSVLAIQARARQNYVNVWYSTIGGGLDEAIILTTTTASGKVAVNIAPGDRHSGAANGKSVVAGVSVSQTLLANKLDIGRLNNGSAPLNGTVKRLVYYPKRLSNDSLIALTT